MKTFKRFILSLSTLLLVSGAALAVPVSARDGTGGSGSSGSGGIADASASDSTTASSDSTTGGETQTEVENHANDLAEQFRTAAQSVLAEKKTQIKEHTQAERQKACEARKTSLENRMSRAVTQAQKHKEVFDKIYSRVKDFYTTKNLNVSDYATLTAAVDKSQADAAASITALQNLDVSVDCTSQTVASSVSTFQQAVKSTRDSLKAYRAALVDLINSLKGASTGAGSDSTDNSTNQ
jgi:hypothetical protein